MTFLSQRINLLKQSAFSFYVLSCFFAALGAGLSYITLSWKMISLHSSVSAIAVLMLCFWGPGVVLNPLLGVIIDRFQRSKLMCFSNLIRALLLICFVFIYGEAITSFDLYLLAALLGSFFSFYMPASIALMREIVPDEGLVYANNIIDTAYELGNIIGVGMAGLIIAITSYKAVLITNAALFLLSALMLMNIKKPVSAASRLLTASKKRLLADFISGISYLSKNKSIQIIYTVQLLIMVQMMLAPVLLAPYAKNILHANVAQFGQIEAALSLGVILGNIMVPWAMKYVSAAVITRYLIMLLAVSFFCFANIHSIIYARTLYFFIGIGFSVWPLIMTEAQSKTLFDFQGRVQSSFNGLANLIILIIYLLVFMGDQLISLHYMYFMQVSLCMIAIFLMYVEKKLFLAN